MIMINISHFLIFVLQIMESIIKLSINVASDLWFLIAKYLKRNDLLSFRLVNHDCKNIISKIEEKDPELFGNGKVIITLKKWGFMDYFFRLTIDKNYEIYKYWHIMEEFALILKNKKSFIPKINFKDDDGIWLIKSDKTDEKCSFGIKKDKDIFYFDLKRGSEPTIRILLDQEIPIIFYLIQKICITSFENFDFEKEPLIIKSPGIFECNRLFKQYLL